MVSGRSRRTVHPDESGVMRVKKAYVVKCYSIQPFVRPNYSQSSPFPCSCRFEETGIQPSQISGPDRTPIVSIHEHRPESQRQHMNRALKGDGYSPVNLLRHPPIGRVAPANTHEIIPYFP